MNPIKTVTVVCPIYNEIRYIDAFIASVAAQDYPKELVEVLLVDGMSEDGTREKINGYLSRYKYIRLIDNPRRIAPAAMNIGIRLSKADVIIRLDAHSIYPANYFSVLVEQLYALGADNVGGVWNTMPAKNTPICHAIAIASSHPLGVGTSTHKIGTDSICEADTVPFGCFRRDVFERIGYFDENFKRAQDCEFNARIRLNGGKIFLIPQVRIDYYARDTFSKMRRMYFQYGMFKPLANKKLGHAVNWRQFMPVMFVIAIVAGIILSPFSKLAAIIFACIMGVYFALSLLVGLQYAITKRMPPLLTLLPYAFFNIHVCYGCGHIVGMYKVWRHKAMNVKVTR